MYDAFKQGSLLLLPPMLLTMLLSMGFPLLPRPVKVETYFSEPLHIGEEESAEDFAERVRSALQELVDRVEASPLVDQRSALHWMAMLPYGAYTFLQNTALYSLAAVMIASTYPPLLLYSAYTALAGEDGDSERKKRKNS